MYITCLKVPKSHTKILYFLKEFKLDQAITYEKAKYVMAVMIFLLFKTYEEGTIIRMKEKL